MLEHKLPPNGHIGLTQRCWDNIREGVVRCLKNTSDLEKCLEKCAKTGNETWENILNGRLPQRLAEIQTTPYFFDLKDDQMTFWENHVQTHPFAAIFAPERLQKLKALRASSK